MATRISSTDITSDLTRHTAKLVKLPPPLTGYSWQVTWLPGQRLSRNEAITAMMIAETVAVHEFKPVGTETGDVDPVWLHIDQWAADLGITGPHAVAVASLSPEDLTDDDEHPNAEDSDPVAGGF